MKPSTAEMQKTIRRGEFTVQYGLIDVALTHYPAQGRMMVLVFGWFGSGYEPAHFSLN